MLAPCGPILKRLQEKFPRATYGDLHRTFAYTRLWEQKTTRPTRKKGDSSGGEKEKRTETQDPQKQESEAGGLHGVAQERMGNGQSKGCLVCRIICSMVCGRHETELPAGVQAGNASSQTCSASSLAYALCHFPESVAS